MISKWKTKEASIDPKHVNVAEEASLAVFAIAEGLDEKVRFGQYDDALRSLQVLERELHKLNNALVKLV